MHDPMTVVCNNGDKIRINHAGKTVGRLTILNEWKRTNGNTLWKAKCVCGNETWVYAGHLTAKSTQSCGCLRTENAIKQRSIYRPSAPLKRQDGASAFITLYNNYRKKAIKRNLNFQLTPDEFMRITKENCHYCGMQPKQRIYGGGRKVSGSGAYVYNGIDRKDSSKGYSLDNSLPCCGNCNYMKMEMYYDDFITHITNILKHLNKI